LLQPGRVALQLLRPRRADHDYLVFKLAFAEGEPRGYLTTDFWDNYDRIWLQPMYFLVTKWDQQAPLANRLRVGDQTGGNRIFSVGPDSAFYSHSGRRLIRRGRRRNAGWTIHLARQLFEAGLVNASGRTDSPRIGPETVHLPSKDEIPGDLRAAHGRPGRRQSHRHLRRYLGALTNPLPSETEPLDGW